MLSLVIGPFAPIVRRYLFAVPTWDSPDSAGSSCSPPGPSSSATSSTGPSLLASPRSPLPRYAVPIPAQVVLDHHAPAYPAFAASAGLFAFPVSRSSVLAYLRHAALLRGPRVMPLESSPLSAVAVTCRTCHGSPLALFALSASSPPLHHLLPCRRLHPCLAPGPLTPTPGLSLPSLITIATPALITIAIPPFPILTLPVPRPATPAHLRPRPPHPPTMGSRGLAGCRLRQSLAPRCLPLAIRCRRVPRRCHELSHVPRRPRASPVRLLAPQLHLPFATCRASHLAALHGRWPLSLSRTVSTACPLVSRSYVTVNYLKKLHKRACVAMHYDHPWKPSANCVEEMWREDFFCPGATRLPSHHRPLDVDAIVAAQVRACPSCRTLGSLLPTCYMTQMVKCISHGWDPLIDTSARHSWPPFHRNLTSAAKFSGFVSDQMAKYESSLAFRHCVYPNPTSDMVVWNAMGVVIWSSDLDRARVATGIRVTDWTRPTLSCSSSMFPSASSSTCLVPKSRRTP